MPTLVCLGVARPRAATAVRTSRAADFATVSGSAATLLDVQRRTPTADGESNHVEQGRATIESVVDRSGLEREAYESVVVVGTDVESAIVQAIGEYDTVRVGLSEKRVLSRTMFGSLVERISRETTGNVGIVRSAEAVRSLPSDSGE